MLQSLVESLLFVFLNHHFLKLIMFLPVSQTLVNSGKNLLSPNAVPAPSVTVNSPIDHIQTAAMFPLS